jgi:hypothetical protein
MTARTHVYSALVFLPAAARALDSPSHVSQVRVWGYGASWLDFVRRCVAAEVEYTSPGAKNPYARASNNLRWNGGETAEDDKLRLALGFPHTLFVSKLDGPTVGPGGAITWPFRGAYLLPDVEQRATSYRLLRVELTKVPTAENPIEVAIPGRPSPTRQGWRSPSRVIGTVHREAGSWVARPADGSMPLLALGGLNDALRAMVRLDDQAEAQRPRVTV